MRAYRPIATIVLALVFAVLTDSTSFARGRHGTAQSGTTDNKPADANAAVCHTKARDYAYEKHADPGQERSFYDTCMSH